MGTIAQANASVLLYHKETTYGTAPTGAGNTYSTARIISAALAQRTGFTQSAQLNTSRQPTETIRNQVSAEGNIGFEFSAVAHQAFLESLFGANFSTDIQTSSTASITTGSTTMTIQASASIFTNIQVGDWVRIDNATNSANEGSFYVVTKTNATTIVVSHSGSVAESVTAGMKFSSSRLALGSTLTSIAMEQEVPTTQELYELAAGAVMTGMRLDIAPGEIIRGSFDWVGKNVAQSTTSITSLTPYSIVTTQIANAIDNVVQIREGNMGTAETWKLASFSLNISSPAEPRYAISDAPGQTPGAISMALRPFSATATIRAYVEHGTNEANGVKDLIDAYLAGTARSGLAVVIADNTDASLYNTIFHFNSYKITRADIPIGGNDQDLFLEMEITAIQDATAGGALGPWSFMVHQNKTF